MRALVKVQFTDEGPIIHLTVHDAPHRRMHRSTIQQYRGVLRAAFHKAGLLTPIDYPITLSILFVNPSSPDFGNLYLAMEQAMDGKTLKGPGVLTDDSLIYEVRRLRKMYV